MEGRNQTAIAPCKQCGGQPDFTWHMSYGHGDCGFDSLRLRCKCGISIGDESNWGMPSAKDKAPVIELWNKINSNGNEGHRF